MAKIANKEDANVDDDEDDDDVSKQTIRKSLAA